MARLLDPIPISLPTFIDAPRCDDLDTLDADVAVVGVEGGVPYDMEGAKFPAGGALQTIREQSMRFGRFISHYDYDLGGAAFAGRDVTVVDCGNVAMVPGAFAENVERTTEVVRQILERGALPVVLGGSHEISIPVFRAYEGLDPMYLVQLDAHLDWRDEINGVRDGLSSVMRRASEMSWVSGMAQIGLRGVGSARQQEVDDARAYGALLIGAQEVHQDGVDAVLGRIPDADRYYITLDADGLDPTIAPAVGAPAFGGLTYSEAIGLLRGVARRGKVVGFDLPVVRPHLDVQNRTSLLAARLVLFMIGVLAHEGQIGS